MTIGQPLPRIDGPTKVSGRARFTDDFTMPGQRVAAYVRSPIAHGLVRTINSTAALALPGVDAVFTAADVPTHPFTTAGHPWHLDPAKRDVADRRLLTDYVRVHGDEVAIVVATDALTAAQAVRLVTIDYDELPPLTDPEAALAQNAPALHPKGNLLGEHAFTCGEDPETLLAAADIVVSGRYHTPIVQHCHLENHIAIAWMDDLERIIIQSSTQIPHICRRVVGQALGIPWSRVRVLKPYVGGGFGAKQDVILEPMVAFLTMHLGGVPVKLELSREECMLGTRTRHPMDIHGRLATTREGKITAISLDVLSNTGGYASHGHSIASAGGAKGPALYPRSAFAFHARTVYTNIPVGGAMRGYGSPQILYAVDCLVEQAAKELGQDPVEFRIANVGRPGDVNPLKKVPIATHALVECLEKGRALFHWDERQATMLRKRLEQTSPLRYGLGIACASFGTGVYPISAETSSARCTLNQDGTVCLAVGATEIGQGADTIFAQMTAHTVGIPVGAVHVISTQDTDWGIFDPGAFASRQTFMASAAIKAAALKLRGRILEHAGRMLEQDPARLDLQNGRIVALAKLNTSSVLADQTLIDIALADIAIDAFYHIQRGGQLSGEASVKTHANPPSFCCTFVEVEVDVPLCQARVLDMLSVHDCGTVINPLLATGQVHGGMAMGVGWALYEEILVDPTTARVRNANLLDYKFPTCLDLPDLRAAFVEPYEPTGAYGTKSLGEPAILALAPAIRNAVWDATDVRIDEIPLTPRTLFKHFRRAGLLQG
ncbi:putative xanthine dehydrogenase molybdenum-binding subunit XdhA [Desulfovibrionales bacterium]